MLRRLRALALALPSLYMGVEYTLLSVLRLPRSPLARSQKSSAGSDYLIQWPWS
jgi:hypothetical protein